MGFRSRSKGKSKINKMIETQYKSIKGYNEYIEVEISGKKKEEKECILNDMSYASDVAIDKHKFDKEYDLTKKIVSSIYGTLALAATYFGINDEIKKNYTDLGTEKYEGIVFWVLIIILAISIYYLIRSFIKADYNGKIRDCEGFKYCVVQKLKEIQENKIENIDEEEQKEINTAKTQDDELIKSHGIDRLESNDRENDKLKQSKDVFWKRTFKSIKNSLKREKSEMTFIYIDKVSYGNRED